MVRDDVLEEARRRIREAPNTLNLSGMGLKELPDELGRLTALRTLNLDNNQLRSLPAELGQLTALQELYLNRNQLSELPAELGQLTALRSLNLFKNQLRSLPAELGQLTALRSINLFKNQLRSLPTELGQLSSLQYLFLSENQLRSLPAELGQISTLRELNVRNNKLRSLPAELGRLTALLALRAEGNQLRSLPTELGQIPTLRELKLDGNEELGLSDEILSSTPKTILDFYFAQKAEGAEPMREVRLLLVGRGRVGKTTLLNALRGKPVNEREPETPGINVEPLSVRCEKGTAKGHVWDFGGQEFLHGTHQIFLAERCVYLLVLEGRGSNWELETDYWIRFIQSFGGDSPVIVVLTKFAKHPFTVDQYRLQERCRQIVGFVETDAFTKLGIPELKSLIANTVNEMPDVWQPFPKSWHRVKEKIVRMRRSFLTYPAFQKECRKAGVDDEDKQSSLAEILHRLGVALNFREHHRLRETSVLKPEWVTDAIYGLLRYVQKQQSNGVLEQAWVSRALDAKTYPTHLHPFVLELMEKFEVAFSIEGTDKWLIPELLHENQPQAFDEFQGPGVRRLRFSYPEALPPGLLPRFIVRTHELSDKHRELRWRSGVLLERHGARALVRMNRLERRTDVAVIDEPPSTEQRQSLFDFIRAHLDVLHGNVRFDEDVELDEHPGSWVSVSKLRLLEADNATETHEETRDRELARVDVSKTLDAVESPEAREARRESAPERLQLFVCYAHEDEARIKLLSHNLTILGQRGYIQAWEDKQLIAGEKWKERILEEIERAEIVLLLHSTPSCASEFIQEIEAPAVLERARTSDGECTLIVVPLDPRDWDTSDSLEAELETLQAATWGKKPVLRYRPISDGWLEVEEAIRKVVIKRREERGR